ncbi:hypothetical protein BU23DRAFT_506875, partial [Bimuria novae-zelandiae CBS 107.79]
MSPNTPATLPPNVTIFSPKSKDAATSLLHARLFTRLSASTSTTPSQLSSALTSHAQVNETFCLTHGNAILIFDGGLEGAELEDAHHEHFRAVCLTLKDADIGLDVAKCVHDAGDALQSGFQLDALKDGAVLVIDLMQAEDDEDDNDS